MAKEIKAMLHRANTRGSTNLGWLQSKHSFSFGSYHDSERMGFGMLRVINDDQVAPAQGFPTHHHQEMEIISIPLQGSLKHKDSVGNETVISQDEIQLMSAGTGVYHSEFNASDKEDVRFLQIWVLPDKIGIKPRYDQMNFNPMERQNNWQTVVSPLDHSCPGVKINQQAWFSLIECKSELQFLYNHKKIGHGIYFFVIEGEVIIENHDLSHRDGLGVISTSSVSLKSHKKSTILAMEVPIIQES